MRFTTLLLSFLFAFPTVFTAQNSVEGDLRKLETFLRSVDAKYVDSISTESLVEKGIRSMLEELDPHSTYFTAEQYKAANEPLAGKFDGIGIRFQMIADTMTILEVLDGAAAQRVGIRMGDQVIAVDGDTVAGKNVPSSVITEKFRSEHSRPLTVSVWRDHGRERSVYSLQRGEVQVSSVPAYFVLDSRTGYIKLLRFSSTSLEDFRAALDELTARNIDNLIVDLRGNSGGYLNVAVKIVDEFLSDRKLIVYTEGIHQPRKDINATTGGRFTEGKLVVLIDENSASASEIVAGAIQDWDRGLVVGRRSYGKGLVQRTVEFDDGSAMRLTISRYYTPTGRSIQKPYENGLEAYRDDLLNRRENGELFSADSIRIDDSQVYYTPGGRHVYGGGGIVPDVFVSVDTLARTEVMRDLEKTGLFYAYALDYTRHHEAELRKRYPDVEKFAARFVVDDAMLLDLHAYYQRREGKLDIGRFIDSGEEINKALKPLIARFHYGYMEYYYVEAQYDEMILKAVQEFDNGTFRELGLN